MATTDKTGPKTTLQPTRQEPIGVPVGPTLIDRHLRSNKLLNKAYQLITKDREVTELWKLSNINAVTRLLYNDHGPVHARIAAGSALEIFSLLVTNGVKPTSVEQGTAGNIEEAKLIVMLGALLHDIGNSIHRYQHELVGALLAKDILDRILPKTLGPKHPYLYSIRQETLHAIYATAMDVQALTVEAGTVKIADGTDMAEGRARFPYRRGKTDIHALSALSIQKVYISRGRERPIRITVQLSDKAGFFQIERILLPKINTTPISRYFEIQAITPLPNKKNNDQTQTETITIKP